MFSLLNFLSELDDVLIRLGVALIIHVNNWLGTLILCNLSLLVSYLFPISINCNWVNETRVRGDIKTWTPSWRKYRVLGEMKFYRWWMILLFEVIWYVCFAQNSIQIKCNLESMQDYNSAEKSSQYWMELKSLNSCLIGKLFFQKCWGIVISILYISMIISTILSWRCHYCKVSFKVFSFGSCKHRVVICNNL